ncbi:MAG: hypothetical protein RL347_543 [Actinomycetota bacterium]
MSGPVSDGEPDRDDRGRGHDHDDESRLQRFEDSIEEAAEEFVEGFEETVDRVLPPHLRARAWARRRRSTHVLWQAGVLLLGFGLVAAGIAMLVLPGPGWATIILGFIVLASEYAWARRLLEPVRRWARRAADAALDPRVRKRNIALASAAAVVAVAGLAWYVAAYGFTLQPVTSLLPG